ncbi:hypothetical protein FraQA3DRAFT_1660 [Frankia sp. QA3]|nr:hypothetical protein FraQA3DRAFT_1660 [Frankia sp. QA3]
MVIRYVTVLVQARETRTPTGVNAIFLGFVAGFVLAALTAPVGVVGAAFLPQSVVRGRVDRGGGSMSVA